MKLYISTLDAIEKTLESFEQDVRETQKNYCSDTWIPGYYTRRAAKDNIGKVSTSYYNYLLVLNQRDDLMTRNMFADKISEEIRELQNKIGDKKELISFLKDKE